MQKILLIEDNDALRENTAEILSLASYQVSTAENGKIGIEMALNNPPDLIICDIMMPVLDGYGVYQIINKNEALQHIPFIFLSAKSERSDLRKGMEMGADDYITKPFTDAELINAIKTRLEKIKNIQNRAVHKSSEMGKELITNLLSAGDFFGYASLIENKIYEEFAETLEESSIRVIPRKEFEELISNNHEIALKVIKLLANNINEKEQQLVALAYHSLRKRVADALLTLKKKYDAEQNEYFSIAISREDLANIAGTATESLIRTLSDFKSEKLISIQDGKITLLEEKKLASLFN